MDRFRKSGFTVDDAATAFYDASITAIKNLAKNLDQHPDVELVVKNMEVALDQMFLANPGMVVPRNGSAGPMMSDFTKDAELR